MIEYIINGVRQSSLGLSVINTINAKNDNYFHDVNEEPTATAQFFSHEDA